MDDPAALAEAHQILVSSGAVAYCAYLLVRRYQSARRLLAQMELPNPQPLSVLLDAYADSLLRLLQLAGVDLTREALSEASAAP